MRSEDKEGAFLFVGFDVVVNGHEYGVSGKAASDLRRISRELEVNVREVAEES